MNPSVSIIVVSANLKQNISGLLESLNSQKTEAIEVILVEQGRHRSEGEIPLPQPLREQTEVLRFKKDLGFCQANNLAAKKARGKYLFFVNDDVSLAPGCIEHLIGRIESEDQDRIAVVQPKILSRRFLNFFEYAGAAGGLIDKYGYCFCRGRIIFTLEEDKGQYDSAEDIFWASGAAFFVPKELFLEFGGFDERFFAYHEETDLCWRLKNANYRIVFEPKAVVYHQGESSWRKRRFLKIFLIHRNHYWLLAKNLSIRQYFKVLPVKIALDLAALSYYASHLDLLATLTAFFGGIVGFLQSPSFINRPLSKYHSAEKLASTLIYPRSIAIEYFLRGKRTYHELLGKTKPREIKTKQYQEFG